MTTDHTSGAAPPTQPGITIIIPAFNEATRIPRSLDRIADYACQTSLPIEVLVVDDGSSDGTAASADQYRNRLHLSVLRNGRNRGKGYSLRHGVREARGSLILLCDADLATPIEELPRLQAALTQGADIAIASRDLPDSRIDPPRPWNRRLAGYLFRSIRSRLVLPDLRDTQCGFKLFRADAARSVFDRQVIDGFGYDVEVLLLARLQQFTIREVGVAWHEQEGSKVRPIRDGIQMLLDVVRLRRRLGNGAPPIPPSSRATASCETLKQAQ